MQSNLSDIQPDISLTNEIAFNKPNTSNQFEPNGQPVSVYTHNTGSKAGLSLVFGLTSFFGILLPLVGVILGTLGIVNSRKALKLNSKGLAISGMIVSILGIIISIISWICSIFLAATRF